MILQCLFYVLLMSCYHSPDEFNCYVMFVESVGKFWSCWKLEPPECAKNTQYTYFLSLCCSSSGGFDGASDECITGEHGTDVERIHIAVGHHSTFSLCLLLRLRLIELYWSAVYVRSCLSIFVAPAPCLLQIRSSEAQIFCRTGDFDWLT